MRRILVLGMLLLVALPSAATAQVTRGRPIAATPPPAVCGNLVGQWRNELGSTLTIASVQATSGAIAGTYSSPSGAGPTAFPLVGWMNSRSATPSVGQQTPNVVVPVAFSVRWGQMGSITSWTGYCEDANGSARIRVLWHLSRPVSDFAWDHILSGLDMFLRIP